MRKKMLPQEALKLIACITMLIDHFGASILLELQIPHMEAVYYVCRGMGRFAFPIYCFLLAEGMRHTRNPVKYILRLGIGIALAELPFDFLFEGGFTWAYQSVMVTLTLGAVMILCMQKTDKKWLQMLLVLPFALLAGYAHSDYGRWGIAMIAVFALFERLPMQLLGLLLINVLMGSMAVPLLGMSVPIQLFAVLAMIPIALYSGKKLFRSCVIQWGFYLFYPVHLLILWMILLLIR